MSQAAETVVDHLRHALIEAANKPDVRAARATSTATLARTKMHGQEYSQECNAADLAYWDALAAETYAELPEGVRTLIGRKLTPGLREVNAQLRSAIGKHVVIWMKGDHHVGKITLEDAKTPVCTNCGAEYPDSDAKCPVCGVA